MTNAWRFAISRLLWAIPTLWLLLTLTFFLMRIAPGGPFDSERTLAPEVEAALSAAYRLDASLMSQYLAYLADLLRGDLGPSFQYVDVRVSDLIAAAFPVSALLGGLALIVALITGVVLGVAVAQRPGGMWDRIISIGSAGMISVPAFVVAPLLVLWLAVEKQWLPAGGWGQGDWRYVVMPVSALALPQIAYVTRLVRGGLIDAMRQPYVTTAIALGFSRRRVVWAYALRPALLPLLSYLGPAAAALMTGSVVIEQIFGIPGLGRHFVQGALNRDYTVVLGAVLVYGSLVILFNAAVDLGYGLLDPRVRSS